MTTRVDFSGNATVYDRRHGALLSRADADRLCEAARLRAGTKVLDVGAGTGRVAIPLADTGCAVTAVEPATGMVAELRAKSQRSLVTVIAGEGAHLPFAAASFDAVVIARLLYLTPDWQQILAEARRVLVSAGSLLHEWGNGQSDEPWVQVREKARQLFESAGVTAPFHPGVRAEADVERRLEELGFVRAGGVSMGGGPVMPLAQFLQRLVDGELSYTWAIPETVRAACLPRLVSWTRQTFDIEAPTAMPREMSWNVYRRDAA